MIISLEKAYQLLKEEEDVVFADCRFDLGNTKLGEALFNEKHIKQAVYFHLDKDLSGEVKETGGRHPLPHLDDFTKTLAEKGISKETTVIAYCNNRAFSSRFYWMMTYIGHENIYLLNGGLDEWEERGYPTETDQSTVKEKEAYGSINVQEHLLANQSDVKNQLDSINICLIDSRAYERYAGKHEPIDHKAGHIPGAMNFEWTNVLTKEGYFKSKEELKAYFEPLNQFGEIIVYCGSGVTAVPNVLALKHAGFEQVRLYAGSFSDWITNEDNDVITIN